MKTYGQEAIRRSSVIFTNLPESTRTCIDHMSQNGTLGHMSVFTDTNQHNG